MRVEVEAEALKAGRGGIGQQDVGGVGACRGLSGSGG